MPPFKTPAFLPYFLSHYLFFIVLLVALIIGFTASMSSTAGPFVSANRIHQFAEEPFYFVHLSDLHFSHAFPERSERVRTLITNAVNRVQSNLTVVTGDLADATDTQYAFEVRRQYIGNWIEYNETVVGSGLSSPTSRLLVVPGNHDLYNTESYDSPNNFYPRFTGEPEDGFHVQAVDYEGLRFITVNPVRFPYITVPLGVMPFILSEYLDQIEALIAGNMTNIIVCHYPVMTMWSSRSVVDTFKKAEVVLTGHTHPAHVQITHCGDAIGVVCPPLAYSDYGGLVTVEEGGFVWHEFSLETDDLVVVTFPVPLSQLSPLQIFNENSFPVRALSFSVNPIEMTVSIDGVSYGTLPVVREIRPRVWLYSLSIELGNGLHLLSLSGPTPQEFEFFIGQESPKVRESGFNFAAGIVLGLAVFFGVLCLLKLIPWWIPLVSHIDRFSDFLYFGTGDIPWYCQLWMGPAYLWSRLRKVPLLMYIVLWFALLWPLVIPFYVTKIESTVAVLWCWGYFAKGEHFRFNVPIIVLAIYFIAVEVPLINIASTFYEGARLCLAQKIELGLFVLPILIGMVAWFLVTLAAGGAFTLFTSPGLYILFGLTGFVLGKSFVDYRDRL